MGNMSDWLAQCQKSVTGLDGKYVRLVGPLSEIPWLCEIGSMICKLYLSVKVGNTFLRKSVQLSYLSICQVFWSANVCQLSYLSMCQVLWSANVCQLSYLPCIRYCGSASVCQLSYLPCIKYCGLPVSVS